MPALTPSRYFIPDLSPEFRSELKRARVRWVFVAESPHTSEVEPESAEQRRPLCGSAGRAWWKALGEILEQDPSSDTSLERLLRICKNHGIAVMNAAQVPLDSKITKLFPKADPLKALGFSKDPGKSYYKNQKASKGMKAAIDSLRRRLTHAAVRQADIYALGNDAEWFVQEALKENPKNLERVKGKIAHPSAWWRRAGYFGKIAKEKLKEILSKKQLAAI